jgi:hypothetical protein
MSTTLAIIVMLTKAHPAAAEFVAAAGGMSAPCGAAWLDIDMRVACNNPRP